MAKKKVEKQNVALRQFRTEHVPLKSVYPNAYNPNRQSDDDFELLLKSIIEDGFTQPVVVLEDTREIVDGEHRWTAMIVLSYLEATGQLDVVGTEAGREIIRDARRRRGEILKEIDSGIDVVPVNMTDVQRKIATLRHNRARGSEEMDLLSSLMRDFEAAGVMDWAADSLDMEQEEIDRLLSYGDSILDHFPAEEPSPAWEVRQTLPGQVQGWSDPERTEVQHVSPLASTPTGYVHPTPTVPGLGKNAPDGNGPPPPPTPMMARRIFVMTEGEADIVDRALGDNPAARLIDVCRSLLEVAEGEGVEG